MVDNNTDTEHLPSGTVPIYYQFGDVPCSAVPDLHGRYNLTADPFPRSRSPIGVQLQDASGCHRGWIRQGSGRKLLRLLEKGRELEAIVTEVGKRTAWVIGKDRVEGVVHWRVKDGGMENGRVDAGTVEMEDTKGVHLITEIGAASGSLVRI